MQSSRALLLLPQLPPPPPPATCRWLEVAGCRLRLAAAFLPVPPQSPSCGPLPSVPLAAGGPFPVIGGPGHDKLTAFLKRWPQQLAAKPKQILVISGHWEASLFRLLLLLHFCRQDCWCACRHRACCCCGRAAPPLHTGC